MAGVINLTVGLVGQKKKKKTDRTGFQYINGLHRWQSLTNVFRPRRFIYDKNFIVYCGMVVGKMSRTGRIHRRLLADAIRTSESTRGCPVFSIVKLLAVIPLLFG